ncbi:MAG: CDP-diacylglycerol--glycerol-3-phosphate 3-phosphatidyltransferase [Bacilli bacterium]|nr:CDP-diacylglycerol--glycerol-3-phosphate 3-phosphatidyltransferase [Bacilli bacterium]
MNLPNKITLFRVFLIPIIMVIAEIDSLQTQFIGTLTLGNFIMLIIFLIGTFSDFLDGYIARKQHIVTDFGKFADPLADKILVLALMIILLEQKTLLPGYAVTLILAREFIVTGFRILAASKKVVIAAGWLGKIKTNLQFIMVILILINGPAPLKLGVFEYIILVVVYATVLMTIISGAEYIIKNIHVFKIEEKGEE